MIYIYICFCNLIYMTVFSHITSPPSAPGDNAPNLSTHFEAPF